MEHIMLWGTGKVSGLVLDDCKTLDQYDLLGVIDNDIRKHNQEFRGLRVLPPCSLDAYKGKIDKIVILAEAFEEIKKQIISLDSSFEEKIENKNYFYKQSIIKRYSDCDDVEIKMIVNRLSQKPLEVFNYDFTDKYKNVELDIHFDNSSDLFYAVIGGKNLYFPRSFSDKKSVLAYCRSILIEQDKQSPHRYIDDDFDVNEGDVVVDAGVAEGNFALDIIDRAKRVYLIEADSLWVEALHHTFDKYGDKIKIINKYVSSYCEGKLSTLDAMVQESVDFIKMDIEGSEYDALLGAEMLMSKPGPMKVAACCYHGDYDQILIQNELGKYGFSCTCTDGYMWFPYTCKQSQVSTKLNRGIVRGIK